ncbi:MAG: sulfate reduction electron transfer complex DsrMKJOP subunit DsrJ [Desulfatibacillaceae bacterium]|nr:sulfate reduction electron transfer complex DsrMKJOP subunit DsrJ [Desulfatibacillaceae bacterium]
MYDKGKVITGIVLFVIVFTFPFWINVGKANIAPEPKINPEVAGKVCVEDKAFMKANHMQLLDEWRDSVVRDGNRTYMGGTGRYEMSLTNSCMGCHNNKAQFCDSCHNYISLTPNCWNCHIESKENTNG